MRWYVPCKLGEMYPETEFLSWVNGTRVYGYTGKELQLIEVNVGMKADWACVPEEYRDYVSIKNKCVNSLEKYNVGKFNFEKMILEISDSEFEERLLGKKKVRLIGLRYSESGLLGHYITVDRYEHFYEPIEIKVMYSEMKNNRYIQFKFKTNY